MSKHKHNTPIAAARPALPAGLETIAIGETILPSHLTAAGMLTRVAAGSLMSVAAVMLAASHARHLSVLQSFRLTDYRVPVESGRCLTLVARAGRSRPGGLLVMVEALAETLTTGERVVVADGVFEIATYPARPHEEYQG